VINNDFPYERHLIKTNRVLLHTVMAGAEGAPLVVLLHGFPEFWYGWRKQIDALAAAGFRVAAPDMRGYNGSDKPKGIASYRLDALVEDINGLIRALGYNTAFVVGHDWGAIVAWTLALTYSRRVDKLAILNVPHPAVFQQTVRSSIKQLFKSWYVAAFQVPVLPETLISLNRYEFFLRFMQRDAKPGSFSDADLEQYRAAWSKPGAMRSMINYYRAIIQQPRSQIQDIRVHKPTLMIWGARDRYLSKEMAQPSIDLCDNGRLVMINDATHWVQHDAAAQVNSLLIDFFKETPTKDTL
jgi:epoxide hydrolase 4